MRGLDERRGGEGRGEGILQNFGQHNAQGLRDERPSSRSHDDLERGGAASGQGGGGGVEEEARGAGRAGGWELDLASPHVKSERLQRSASHGKDGGQIDCQDDLAGLTFACPAVDGADGEGEKSAPARQEGERQGCCGHPG
eukprot:746732-Hanusia_phi.AAC.1